MSDPQTVSSTVAWATASGLASAFVASLGLTWPILFAGAMGAYVGLGLLTRIGRARAVLLFPGVTFLAAYAGTISAPSVHEMWLHAVSVHLIAQGLAGAVGLLFFPATVRAAALVSSVQVKA